VSRAVLHIRQSARRLWWSGALLACLIPPALAQDDGDFSRLLFEPVVINIIESASAVEDAPYTAQELTSLPHAAPAVELQEWLAQRDATPTLPPDQLEAGIAAYEQSVLALESQGGAFAPQLDEDLLGLGSLLLQAGDTTRAQQVLERALHVNRVNDGLFNEGQVPIVERTIEAHLARGDLVAADAQQEYLLYVQRKNLDSRSVDLLPALTRYAEWNLFAFGARLPTVAPAADAVEAPPEENSDTMIDFRTGRLITAHQVYETIINIVANNFGLGDNRLLNFERQLALTNYLYINSFGLQGEMDPLMMPYGGYLQDFAGGLEGSGRPPLGFRQGRDSLERRVNYLAGKTDVAPAVKAQAKLDLADWMVMYSKRMGSLEVYEEAWRDMVAAGTSADELAALFNPAFPTEIPTYVEHAYTRDALGIPADLTLKYKGFIDVEFKLSRFGVPSTVRVMNKSVTAPPQVESILVRGLRNTHFRPRLVDGTVRDNETMHVRFYFTY
jgi:hypothetical protein